MIGIYLHIPFCRSKCPYCDFYSVSASPSLQAQYIATLQQEMELYHGIKADTLYFGGGTPSLLSGEQFATLIEAAKTHFSLTDAEITTEANPADLTYSYLKSLQKAGINRLSVGIQSLEPAELSCLGRRHTATEALDALTRAKEVGFKNLSVDLMLGTPKQTPDSLKRTLNQLKEIGLTHLSAYLLKLEPNTPFGKEPPSCPSEEETVNLYQLAVEELEQMGLHQYEISNFAEDGFECRHNLKYWKQQPYLGFGAAAHSFWQGRRFCHTSNLFDYQKNPKNTVFLESGGDAKEWFILRLRLKEGILLDEAKERGFSVTALQQKTKPLVEEGLVYPNIDRIILTPKGMLLSNAILLHYDK